jgi:hypothetical protein
VFSLSCSGKNYVLKQFYPLSGRDEYANSSHVAKSCTHKYKIFVLLYTTLNIIAILYTERTFGV